MMQLEQNFTKWEATWIPQSSNGAAHSFTKNAGIVMV